MGRILQAIKAARLTIEEVGSKIGRSRPTIYDWDKKDEELYYKIVKEAVKDLQASKGIGFMINEKDRIGSTYYISPDTEKYIKALEKLVEEYEDKILQLENKLNKYLRNNEIENTGS